MKVLDIAKEQLNSPVQSVILEEFGDSFAEIRDFGPENPNYLRTTRHRVEELEEDEAGRARDLLHDILKRKINRLKKELNEAESPGLILFVGNGVPDGHGILLDGNPWVAIDLKSFADRLETYNQEIYLAHEATHAFHYARSPSFYFANERAAIIHPPIFKMMVAEGVATYGSFISAPCAIHDAYWFGKYPEEKVEEWTDLCEREKEDLADRIDLAKNEAPPDLLEQLFDVKDGELGRSRTGYYYGTKIVENVIEAENLETAMNMELSDYRDYIYSYFGF